MELGLDLWCRLLDLYSKFLINILKHFEKSLENWKKCKTRKNNRENSENKIFLKSGNCFDKYTEGYLHTKFERVILFNEFMIAKNEFDLLLAVN